MNRKFGLVGYPLGHSFSKKYFDKFFEKENLFLCEFQNFEIEDISQIDEIISLNTSLEGFSVTLPHKQDIIPHLTQLDAEAKRVGAVNCVKIIRGQYLIEKIGYNSDVYGFQRSLESFLNEDRNLKSLVLGNGGASKAVCVALENMGIEYLVVSRNSANGMSYSDITEKIFLSHRLIINTTILGMYPNIQRRPDIPYHLITKQHYGFDIIYNPEMTRFLSEFKDREAKYINGSEMLIYQAQRAWEIYNK